MSDNFIVICLDLDLHIFTKDKEANNKENSSRWNIATKTVFRSKYAAQKYADGISTSRCPVVVGGDFSNLRFDSIERGLESNE